MELQEYRFIDRDGSCRLALISKDPESGHVEFNFVPTPGYLCKEAILEEITKALSKSTIVWGTK